MTCIRVPNGIVCLVPFFRIRLLDGSYVFMEFHSYAGPVFYKDKLGARMIENWWDNELLIKACDWFVARGKKA